MTASLEQALHFLENPHADVKSAAKKGMAVKGVAFRAGATGESVPAKAQARKYAITWITYDKTAPRTPLLSSVAIYRLASKLDVDKDLVLQISSIPARTFIRRQEGEKLLTATESDRVLRIARVAGEAERVFGNEEKAKRWLSKSNAVLGATPLELLATDAGAREVEAELTRIDWGDFS